jgi:sulfate-transporting ATPase
LRYAQALAGWGDAGGYAAEVDFDKAAVSVLGQPWESVRDRRVGTLSGGEQKRFALELLLRGPDEVLLLDEPDNFLDVPGKRWLEELIASSTKTILYVSHDRELLSRTAGRVVAVEGGSAWVHPGGFDSWHAARSARHDRLDEQRRRWDEERAKLERLVAYYKAKAAHNDGMASRLQAARTRLARFLDAGPPPEKPHEQQVRMRLRGAWCASSCSWTGSRIRSISRSGSATGWRCSGRTAPGSHTSYGCWPAAARTPSRARCRRAAAGCRR